MFDYSEITFRRRKHVVSVNYDKKIYTVNQKSSKNKFKTKIFYVIIDKLIVEMGKQKKAYLKLDT